MFKERRSGFDRRSTADGRRLFNFGSPVYKGPERRRSQERRSQPERRAEWTRVSQWSSEPSRNLKKVSHAYTPGENSQNVPNLLLIDRLVLWALRRIDRMILSIPST
jgi:hypothetical protein